MISPDVFLIFFLILIFRAFRGIKGKKLLKMKNGYIRHVLYLRNSIWSWFLVHLCKMVISPSVFFNFFKILFFGIVTGVKWQKIAQNHNKLCLSRFISQEHHTSYDCHLWYTCVKWWYLHVFFSFVQNFDFLGCLGVGVKRAKNSPKWQKLCLSCSISQKPYII